MFGKFHRTEAEPSSKLSGIDGSVKILWAGAAAGLVTALALCVGGQVWIGLSFLLAALVMMAAAVLHNKECVRRRSELAMARETAREQVRQAEAEAEAARARCGEDIVRYHSAISHGLRIPISVIIGYAEMMLNRQVVDDGVRDEYLKKICEKAKYVSDVLTHILLEFRTESGVSRIIKKPFELLTLLRSVADDLGAAAGRSGISIKVISEYDAIPIEGDVMGLTKAFYNIIENSIKYMGRYGYINITASKLSPSEALLVFKDDGAGLDPEETAHIFELNYQGSNRRLGNGLGLYIVKTEVASHGGSVYAKSDPGKGMGIYITLPIAQTDTQPSEQSAEPVFQQTEETPARLPSVAKAE